MAELKEMAKNIFIIVIGMVGSYLLVFLLGKLGVTNSDVKDPWNLILALIGCLYTYLAFRNSSIFSRIESKFDKLVVKIEKNEEGDQKRDEHIKELQGKSQSVDNLRKEMDSFKAEIKQDVSDLKTFFLNLFQVRH